MERNESSQDCGMKICITKTKFRLIETIFGFVEVIFLLHATKFRH